MKAISLFSGGLDSQLAVALVKDQDIDVVGVHFSSPFFGGRPEIEDAARSLGIELRCLDVGPEYTSQVLLNPVYGYGKNFNPCIDCHAFMLRKASQLMESLGASFIITGEVLGQRPMSQTRSSLNAVDKLSGCRGIVVRPLSGLLLSPTIPEEKGWLERDKLLDINGRGRTRQMKLAEEYGIVDYPSPAGGCLLTEQNFARRLRRMLEYNQSPQTNDLELLKLGRHFYIDEFVLLVVGRNQSENQRLQKIAAPSDIMLKVTDRPGPLALLRSIKGGQPQLEKPSAIVARYSDARSLPLASLKAFHPSGEIIRTLEVAPYTPDQMPPAI